jgi:hypothetical protein
MAWCGQSRPGEPGCKARSQQAFHTSVVGPHFEEVCRQWARWHAGPETYGGAYPAHVASGTVSDPDARKTTDIDMGAFGHGDGGRNTLLAISEVTWQVPGSARVWSSKHRASVEQASSKHRASVEQASSKRRKTRPSSSSAWTGCTALVIRDCGPNAGGLS